MNGAGFVFYETEEPKHAMKYFTWKFIVIFFFFFNPETFQNIWSATLLEMESSRSLFLLSLNREHVLIIIKSEVFNWKGGGGGGI